MSTPARTAIIHYWLTGMRGGEKVLEAICRIFPHAEIFTLFYEPQNISPYLRSRTIHTSFLNPLRRHYRKLLPLMPLALESFDLRGYDLVISSESGPAKGVLVSAEANHICYCHTPMRYLWELYPYYRNEGTRSGLERMLMTPIASYMRLWDYASAARVDRFIANSENVQRRIWRAYRRSSDMVCPPVPVEDFQYRDSEGYYLIVSEMAAYKRLDYAVRAFANSGRRLKVVGQGPEYKRLRALSAPNIEFCGKVSDSQLATLYSQSAAFIMPGEEDFGITMVESLASGKPVIAFGRGGACEIVKENCGILYQEPREECLDQALKRFESRAVQFEPVSLQMEARRFSPAAFERGFRAAAGLAPPDSDGHLLSGVSDRARQARRGGEGDRQRSPLRGG